MGNNIRSFLSLFLILSLFSSILTSPISISAISIDQESLTPVWRTQLRVVMADVKDAGTDDSVAVILNSKSFWLDYGRNDFERNSSFLYDVGLDDVHTLADITHIVLKKTGGNGMGVKKIELYVNGKIIYDRTFSTGDCKCAWITDNQSFIVSSSTLRNHPNWKSFVNPPVPTIITKSEMESRIEAVFGNVMHGNDLYWDVNAGKEVEISFQNSNTYNVDLDLKADVSKWPDPKIDVDFDLKFTCKNNQIKPELENFDADSKYGRLVTFLLDYLTGVPFATKILEQIIDQIVERTTGNSVSVSNVAESSCVAINIHDNGDLEFILPEPPVSSNVDTDGDGISDNVDACVNESEVFNRFQDTDGCPDSTDISGTSTITSIPVIIIVDLDKDGISDKNDQCPSQPETKNGYQDDDGCPDVIQVKRSYDLSIKTSSMSMTNPTGSLSSNQILKDGDGFQTYFQFFNTGPNDAPDVTVTIRSNSNWIHIDNFQSSKCKQGTFSDEIICNYGYVGVNKYNSFGGFLVNFKVSKASTIVGNSISVTINSNSLPNESGGDTNYTNNEFLLPFQITPDDLTQPSTTPISPTIPTTPTSPTTPQQPPLAKGVDLRLIVDSPVGIRLSPDDYHQLEVNYMNIGPDIAKNVNLKIHYSNLSVLDTNGCSTTSNQDMICSIGTLSPNGNWGTKLFKFKVNENAQGSAVVDVSILDESTGIDNNLNDNKKTNSYEIVNISKYVPPVIQPTPSDKIIESEDFVRTKLLNPSNLENVKISIIKSPIQEGYSARIVIAPTQTISYSDYVNIIVESPTFRFHSDDWKISDISNMDGGLFVSNANSITVHIKFPTGQYYTETFELKQSSMQQSSKIPMMGQDDLIKNEKTERVPSWIKNNAEWWATNQIDDNAYVDGIQFMLRNKIINVPTSTALVDLQQEQVLSTNGKIDILVNFEPYPIQIGKDTKLKIEFLNPQTKQIENQIDYKILINDKFGKPIFGPTQLTHTSSGFTSIPIIFNEKGEFTLLVEVEGISFQRAFDDMTMKFVVNNEITNNAVKTENIKIPDWVKNNAKWWADGSISEDDFLQGLEFLIKNNIVNVN